MLWRGTWVNAGPWVASRSEREKECHGAWGDDGNRVPHSALFSPTRWNF